MRLMFKNMKIIKIKNDVATGRLTVWLDEIPDMGFGFDLDAITGEEDLLEKLERRIEEYNELREREAERAEKTLELQALLGREI